MPESDILIVPQDQTVHQSLVVVTDQQAEANGYKFDVVKRHRTRRSYKPTMHSVPSGSQVSDHVRKDPIAFQLVGVLTPYNVLTLTSALSAFEADEDFTELSDLLGDTANSALEIARKNRDQLIQYADRFTLLTVMGNDFQHPNMIITTIDDPRTPTMGDSYELTVSFRQIRVPRGTARIAPLIASDADLLGGGEVKDLGQ